MGLIKDERMLLQRTYCKIEMLIKAQVTTWQYRMGAYHRELPIFMALINDVIWQGTVVGEPTS